MGVYWSNPLHDSLAGLSVVQLDGLTLRVESRGLAELFGLPPGTQTVSGAALVRAHAGWTSDIVWWYCMVATISFSLGFEGIRLLAIRYISWLRR